MANVGQAAPLAGATYSTFTLPTINGVHELAFIANLDDITGQNRTSGVFLQKHGTPGVAVAWVGMQAPWPADPDNGQPHFTGFIGPAAVAITPPPGPTGGLVFQAIVNRPPEWSDGLWRGRPTGLELASSYGAHVVSNSSIRGTFDGTSSWSADYTLGDIRCGAHLGLPISDVDQITGANRALENETGAVRFRLGAVTYYVASRPDCSTNPVDIPFFAFFGRMNIGGCCPYLDSPSLAGSTTVLYVDPCDNDGPALTNLLVRVGAATPLQVFETIPGTAPDGGTWDTFINYPPTNGGQQDTELSIAIEGDESYSNGTNRWVIWERSAQSARIIAKEGETIGAALPGMTFARPPEFFPLSDAGIAFGPNHVLLTGQILPHAVVHATLHGDGVTAANDGALLVEREVPIGRAWAVCAREGARAPGWSCATFTGQNEPFGVPHLFQNSGQLAMPVATDALGNVVFQANAFGPQGVVHGIWISKATGTVSCVARPGMHVQVATTGGGQIDRIVVSAEMHLGYLYRQSGNYVRGCNGTNGLGSPISFDGVLAFRAVLTDQNGDSETGVYTIDVSQVPDVNCPADIDDGSGTGTPDGGVTIDDLIYYIGLFETGGICADLDDGTNTGTPDGGVTIDDLLYFLFHFQLGC